MKSKNSNSPLNDNTMLHSRPLQYFAHEYFGSTVFTVLNFAFNMLKHLYTYHVVSVHVVALDVAYKKAHDS